MKKDIGTHHRIINTLGIIPHKNCHTTAQRHPSEIVISSTIHTCERTCLLVGLHFGSKKTGKHTIVFEDLSRNSIFF